MYIYMKGSKTEEMDISAPCVETSLLLLRCLTPVASYVVLVD